MRSIVEDGRNVEEQKSIVLHRRVNVMLDALQRKLAEESACGKVHDRAFKITERYFQEKYHITFWLEMDITDLLGLILEMSMHNFVEIFLE